MQKVLACSAALLTASADAPESKISLKDTFSSINTTFTQPKERFVVIDRMQFEYAVDANKNERIDRNEPLHVTPIIKEVLPENVLIQVYLPEHEFCNRRVKTTLYDVGLGVRLDEVKKDFDASKLEGSYVGKPSLVYSFMPSQFRKTVMNHRGSINPMLEASPHELFKGTRMYLIESVEESFTLGKPLRKAGYFYIHYSTPKDSNGIPDKKPSSISQ